VYDEECYSRRCGSIKNEEVWMREREKGKREMREKGRRDG
jgi:hypothetical protein